MKTTRIHAIHGALFLLLVLLLFFAGTAVATAQTDSDYDISWWTVDGGGGASQSADEQYKLNGSIGQPDVGNAAGIGYAVKGGFWGSLGTAIREFFIHLPLVLSQ
jgi:hypothetical protein